MYSIQDVSNKTGLSTHTLRYYEKEGLISDVERSQGGFRQYTDEDLERLGLIRCLKTGAQGTGAGTHGRNAGAPGQGDLEAELLHRKAEGISG